MGQLDIVLYWNCRGASNKSLLANLRMVRQGCRPLIVVLSETKVEDVSRLPSLRSLGYDGVSAVPSVGRSGGIMAVWRSDYIAVTELKKERQMLHFHCVVQGFAPFFLSMIYANPLPALKQILWRELKAISSSTSDPWIVIGDFNDVLGSSKRVGGWTNGKECIDNKDCFYEVITNPGYVNEEGRLRISPYHDFNKAPHGCGLCPPNMCKTFDHPTDTILGGQILTSGTELVSSSSDTNQSSGTFQFAMQSDGNLVLYPRYSGSTAGDAYWASDSYGGDSSKYYLFLSNTDPRPLCIDNNRCKKQTLPLRYVTREARDLSCFTIYFKVGLHSLESNNDNQPPHVKTTSKKAIKVIILIVLGFAVQLCSAVAISGRLIYNIGVLSYRRLFEMGDLGLSQGITLRVFSYNELKKATNGFRLEVGKGSFGSVYKGTLLKGRRLIAVKRLHRFI
ncbi:hypothetical protein K1719_002898 [Acacia pycnantha]|nr:hypothetical protein K1719_002898 [Acacia pycnantha]